MSALLQDPDLRASQLKTNDRGPLSWGLPKEAETSRTAPPFHQKKQKNKSPQLAVYQQQGEGPPDPRCKGFCALPWMLRCAVPVRRAGSRRLAQSDGRTGGQSQPRMDCLVSFKTSDIFRGGGGWERESRRKAGRPFCM